MNSGGGRGHTTSSSARGHGLCRHREGHQEAGFRSSDISLQAPHTSTPYVPSFLVLAAVTDTRLSEGYQFFLPL